MLIPLVDIQAQAEPAVQELQGNLSPGQVNVYRLKDLKQGEKIDFLMQTTSGNLDPLLVVVPVYTDLKSLISSYSAAVQSLISDLAQPLLDLPALRDKYFLAWDDDSGPGYSASLEFKYRRMAIITCSPAARSPPPGAQPPVITGCCSVWMLHRYWMEPLHLPVQSLPYRIRQSWAPISSRSSAAA